jgi:hypothetical protein
MRRDYLEDLGVNGRTILKWFINTGCDVALIDLTHERDHLRVLSVHVDELSGSLNCWDFVDTLSSCQLRKKDSENV